MSEKKEIVIVGEALRLRPLEKQELQLKIKWINDPEVHKYLHYDVPLSLDKTKQWFQKVINDPSRYDLVIETLEGKPIGLIGLIGITERDRTAEIYIAIGEKKYWGKGIMAEAESLLIEWGFKTLDLHKIWGETRYNNVASIITMKKLGFQIEGTLREEKCVGGERVDIIRMGLLRREFKPV